jgi:hypothetical protein
MKNKLNQIIENKIFKTIIIITYFVMGITYIFSPVKKGPSFSMIVFYILSPIFLTTKEYRIYPLILAVIIFVVITVMKVLNL